MSRISSLTETIGLRSPQSCCGGGGAGDAFEDDEQPEIERAIPRTPMPILISPRTRTPDIRPPDWVVPESTPPGLVRQGAPRRPHQPWQADGQARGTALRNVARF